MFGGGGQFGQTDWWGTLAPPAPMVATALYVGNINVEGHATSERRSRGRDEPEAEQRRELCAGRDESRTPVKRAETRDQTRDESRESSAPAETRR